MRFYHEFATTLHPCELEGFRSAHKHAPLCTKHLRTVVAMHEAFQGSPGWEIDMHAMSIHRYARQYANARTARSGLPQGLECQCSGKGHRNFVNIDVPISACMHNREAYHALASTAEPPLMPLIHRNIGQSNICKRTLEKCSLLRTLKALLWILTSGGPQLKQEFTTHLQLGTYHV